MMDSLSRADVWGQMSPNGRGFRAHEAINGTEPCKNAFSVSFMQQALHLARVLRIQKVAGSTLSAKKLP